MDDEGNELPEEENAEVGDVEELDRGSSRRKLVQQVSSSIHYKMFYIGNPPPSHLLSFEHIMQHNKIFLYKFMSVLLFTVYLSGC